MLRKVFLKNGVVVAMTECGSTQSDVTCSISDSHVFITNDNIKIDIGYECKTINDISTFAIVPEVIIAPEVLSETPPEEAGVPVYVEMKQARKALFLANYLDAVEAAIAAMPKTDQIEWEFSATVRRYSPLTILLANTLSLTETELDNLFISASKL